MEQGPACFKSYGGLWGKAPFFLGGCILCLKGNIPLARALRFSLCSGFPFLGFVPKDVANEVVFLTYKK
ncbi:hypothetical protein C5O22_02810 [Treponema sp. J25]|nr:hypothetical protein C5O22_02810 [Treponema sp. J25]